MTSYDLSRIHIARWGARGPRVVMVHGGAQGGPTGGEKNFLAQQSLAEAGWQLILPDRPGHGRSPTQGWPDDAELDGAWAAELLGDGAHVVGHSFGGAVALAATARRPAAVHSLTVIEPAMHSLAIDNAHVRKFVFGMMRISLFTLSDAARAERAFEYLGIPPEVAGRYDQDVRARLGRSLRRGRLPRKRTLLRQLAVVREAGIPLLVVSGGWSPAFDASSARAAQLGGGRHVVIASPHHYPHVHSPEFNAVLQEFMEGAAHRARA